MGFHIEMGRSVYWNRSNTVLVSLTQYLAASLKMRYCTVLITYIRLAVLLSKCKATILPDNKKAILCNIMATPRRSCKAISNLLIELDTDPLNDAYNGTNVKATQKISTFLYIIFCLELLMFIH